MYLGVIREVIRARASIDPSYRYYTDTFGIAAHTVSLAWNQEVGSRLIVCPVVRYYEQSEADFYDVSFTGAPEYYSSDYRLSAMSTTSGGLKVVWMPNQRFTADLQYERYVQSGKDDVTPDESYSKANVWSVGAKLWF